MGAAEVDHERQLPLHRRLVEDPNGHGQRTRPGPVGGREASLGIVDEAAGTEQRVERELVVQRRQPDLVNGRRGTGELVDHGIEHGRRCASSRVIDSVGGNGGATRWAGHV